MPELADAVAELRNSPTGLVSINGPTGILEALMVTPQHYAELQRQARVIAVAEAITPKPRMTRKERKAKQAQRIAAEKAEAERRKERNRLLNRPKGKRGQLLTHHYPSLFSGGLVKR